MPRSPLQSDFVITSAPAVEEVIFDIVEGPQAMEVVKLPKAIVRTDQASARSTKIVMTFTWIMLAVLALMCAIGPHIPSGE